MAEKNLEGFDEILAVLRDLGDEKEMQKWLKESNRVILTDVKADMKSSLPFPKSLLKKIGVQQAAVDGNRHPNAMIVGPNTDVYPIRFLNTGTVERYNKKGKYLGKIIGKNAFSPYFDQKVPKIQEEAAKLYGEALVKVGEKKVKKITQKK